MEPINLSQLTRKEGGIHLLGEVLFSGFAVGTFPDGQLETQMALMHGVQDGVTRRWHANGQLESEKAFRNGQPHGQHTEWRADGTLEAQSSWNAGACAHSSGPNRPAAYSRPAPSEARVMHYGYDVQGRLASVGVEPQIPQSASIVALMAMDESAENSPEGPEVPEE